MGLLTLLAGPRGTVRRGPRLTVRLLGDKEGLHVATGAPSLLPFLAPRDSLTLRGLPALLVAVNSFLPLPHKQPFLLACDPFQGVQKRWPGAPGPCVPKPRPPPPALQPPCRIPLLPQGPHPQASSPRAGPHSCHKAPLPLPQSAR